MEASRAVNAETMPPAGSDGAADQAEILQFVEQLGVELSKGTLNLPSFPDAVICIRNVLSDRNATTARVAQVVQAEPVFTAKLFRMANSVMLKRGEDPVTDLKAVINRIGFVQIKNISVALATRQMMNSKQYQGITPVLRELWEHSIETAAIAFVLARDSGCVSPDDALLAGLIHDIGVYYIYSRMSAHPGLFENHSAVADVVLDWHTGIGHAILEDWDFPAAVVEAVDEHESHDRTHVGHADLTDVVTVANLLAHWGLPTQKTVNLADLPALERLNLTPESALQKISDSHADIDAAKQALA